MSNNNYKEYFDSLKTEKDNDKFLNNFIELLKKTFYERNTFVKNSDNDDKRDEFFNYLKTFIKDSYDSYLARSKNNISLSDYIDYLGCGHTSLVFSIGDNVLKISKLSYSYSFNGINKYDCLIPVLYDKKFKVDEKEYYSITLTPMVKMKDFSDEEIYSLYKRLRINGYIWNDPLKENMGIMDSDFVINDISYKKGDVVIIDLEDLAYVGKSVSDDVLDEISMMSYNRKVYIYETRYIDEMEKSDNFIKH